jgi:signal transduction histidine kinase
MLQVQTTTNGVPQQYEHASGPLDLGRGPAVDDVARCQIGDPYVSKNHVRVEPKENGLIQVLNQSSKQPIEFSFYAPLGPGEKGTYALPLQLRVGQTDILIDQAPEDSSEISPLETVAPPMCLRREDETRPIRLDALDSPTPETMACWFESVISLQRSRPGSQEYYDRITRAIVDLLSLDRGLVLLRNGDDWQVIARAFREEGGGGPEYSRSIMKYVLEQKRTFYQAAPKGASTNSIKSLHAVVASPILDAKDNVTGALYGSRALTPRSRNLGPLEAQMIQVLASTVTTSMIAMEQEKEATQFRIARDTAAEADRAKSRFLASMSHELRTPLNAIIGYSEMLIEQAEDEKRDDIQTDVKKILGAGKHLLALINDVLDFSKIEAGKMTLVLDPIDLGKLVQEVVETVQPLVHKNANTLKLEAAPDLGMMSADVVRLRQCLYNLLSNASKFTQSGVITFAARRLNAAQNGDTLIEFRVADTGIGMTADQKRDLFEIFTPAANLTSRKYGGTGMGLAITRKLCQMMGGEIVVDSEVGKGSTFTITLPTKAPAG